MDEIFAQQPMNQLINDGLKPNSQRLNMVSSFIQIVHKSWSRYNIDWRYQPIKIVALQSLIDDVNSSQLGEAQ